MKKFNITGTCVPAKHYMADINGKLEKIIKLIDDEAYFTINRSRQYGKTTTLSMLEKALPAEYFYARISFQNVDNISFETSQAFCQMFLKKISKALEFTSASQEYANEWLDESISNFELLDEHITKMCKDKKVVLSIDEFDKISNYRVFLQFLSTLREKFLLRSEDRDYTFQSVILAGVYDITSLKQKMIDEGLYTLTETEKKVQGSPWNIAIRFDVGMSFNPSEIATMLKEYETDHKTGMDITAISYEIYSYTDGYPFLVSSICQYIDEILVKDWTKAGIQKAVNIIVKEVSTLFEDVFKNLRNDKDLHDYVYGLLILGEMQPFVIHDPTVANGVRYGFFKSVDGRVAISNKIFELAMTDYFISIDRRYSG
jgi:hypothetical protein